MRPWFGSSWRGLVLFVVGVVLTGGAVAAEEEIWDRPPHADPPEELIRAFSDIPVDEDHGVQVLLEEARYVLDDAGRMDYRYRIVYRVDSPGSVRSWSRVTRTWRPWYQDRPVLKARVVLPDGTQHVLDPDDIGEYSEGEEGPDVYGDVKTLRGPLPAVEVGAIVEEMHEVHDREPAFGAGLVRSFTFGQKVPTHHTRLIVDAPVTLPIRHAAHRLPELRIDRTEADGRQRFVFSHGPLPVWELDVSLAPGDVSRRPGVRFSTGESWNAIAKAYSAAVDERIAASDLRKPLRKAAKGEKDRQQLIERLLSFVHDQVRYTGVEFGERSMVPEIPNNTLERRFGDCKDKSTLLVALLRQADIDAHVALLNTGPSNDVDPELPGISRFDHAIVYVPGATAIWIDPTDPFARAGQLPIGDQGRWALVADDETTELIRTPKTSSTDNLRRERREVFLAVEGPARIVETTQVTGAFERSFRRSFSKKNDTETHEQLERYAEAQYKSETLSGFDLSDPHDLAIPMKLRLEAADCSKATTDSRRAAVAIGVGALVRDLPSVLKPEEEPDEDAPARQDPLEFPRPFVVEIRYEIHPPAGYAMLTLPDGGRREFGPAVMTQEYSVEEDGVVIADLRFDSGPVVYSVEQFEQSREAIAEFFEEQVPKVVFHQVGESHLEAGRLREALEEFRALVASEPDEARHRTRVARAYLAAGLGANARREAQRAVELAPESMPAHRTLGIILAHDDLGRKFVRGFDRSGAEKALRKAKQLDPDDYASRGELAILLEHSEDGTRYEVASELDQAIEEYQGIRADLEDERLTTNLLAALLHAGRLEELRTVWEDAPRDASRNALNLAAIAVLDGTQAAIDEATKLTSHADSHRQVLIGAADWLSAARHYPEAAALLATGARGSAEAVELLARADQLRRVQRHEPGGIDTKGPEGRVRSLFADLILDGDSGDPRSMEWFDPELVGSADAEHLEEFLEALRDGVAWQLAQSDLSRQQVLDLFLSLATFAVEGDGEIGWRVTLRVPPAGGTPSQPLFFYLKPSAGGPQVVCLGPLRDMAGPLLLDWIDGERIDTARRWLDWLVADTAGQRGEDELDLQPITLIWQKDAANDPVLMRAAAASLMIDGLYDERALEELNPVSESFPDEGPARVGLELARLRAAGVTEDYEIQLTAAERLAAAHPRSTYAFQARIFALVNLKRFDEAEGVARSWLEERPNESIAISLYADLPHYQDRLDEHRKRLQEMIDAGRASGGEYNNLAWLDIVEDRVDEQTLYHAQQAVAMTDYSSLPSLHTLATVYAELGQVAEARDVLLALVANRVTNELESHDWYVLGRIAEQYGVPDAAIEAYERVEPPEEGTPESTSTFLLAQRGIARARGAAAERESSP